MLPCHSLLRSPSTRILAELQRDIFAQSKPPRYEEPDDVQANEEEDVEAAAEAERLLAGGSSALAALLHLRAQLSQGITREGRMLKGCESFLK